MVATYYIYNKQGRRSGLQELFLLPSSDFRDVDPDRLKVEEEAGGIKGRRGVRMDEWMEGRARLAVTPLLSIYVYTYIVHTRIHIPASSGDRAVMVLVGERAWNSASASSCTPCVCVE